MLGREKTSQQDRTSYSLKTNVTFRIRLWDNMFTYFCFIFFQSPKSLFFWIFQPFLCTVKFIWPLSCSPRQEYALGLYSSPQMMEINSHKRSGPLRQAEPPAWDSSVPFEWQTIAKKKKKNLPLVLFSWNAIENLLKLSPICNTVLYWSSSFRAGGSTRRCAHVELCAGWEWCRSPGHDLFFFLCLLFFYF